jgi:PAS domain S-box-containing protein
MALAFSTLSLSPADDLLRATLAVSLTAINLLRPLFGPTGEIVDFAVEYLNPAAQRLVQLPERPVGTLATLFPHAATNGLLDFYRRVYGTGEASTYDFTHPADGYEGFYLVAAQRSGELLVVSLTDASAYEPATLEQALRTSQAREQAARLAAERERSLLETVLQQAPVAIGLFQGPEQRVVAANEQLGAMWGHAPADVLGKPLLEAMPELRGQGFAEHIAEVARTGVPFVGRELAAQLVRQGRLDTAYFNFVYQPLYDGRGELLGVLDIATEVTEQVLARQQVQNLYEELAVINEELRATNEEFLASNAELARAQAELQQLNQQLEIRVLARTRALAEARAQADNQRRHLERFFEQAPAAICVLGGPDMVFELVNPAYQRLFPDRQLLGLPLLEAQPGLVGHPVWHTLRRVYATGQTYEERDVLIPLPTYQGGPLEDFYFHYIHQARYDEQGRIDGLLVFALDVTAQVLTKQRAQVLQSQMLAATQAQLQAVLAQAPVAIAIVRGSDYLIELANPLITRIWGRTQERLLGRPLFEVLPEAREQGFPEILAHVRQSGQAFRAQEVGVLLERHGRLEKVHLNFVYQPLHDEDGRIDSVAIVATEVSEQVTSRQQVANTNEQLRTINTELDETNQQLLRTNADLDNFIYTASHDLKAPITNIEGLLEALLEQLPPEAHQAEQVAPLLRMMQGSVERFQKTIAQLTDISRLQQAHLHPAEVVDLAALVEDVRLDLAPELIQGATLTLDLAACPTVAFSAKNLRSIIYNLLSNGLKYRAPERLPVVQLRCHRYEHDVVLEVQDNGLGLDEVQQRQLFRMFQRLHSHVEGSGVGLYMVKKIVENAGGAITVQSQPGTGTTFRVVLPGQVG